MVLKKSRADLRSPTELNTGKAMKEDEKEEEEKKRNEAAEPERKEERSSKIAF